MPPSRIGSNPLQRWRNSHRWSTGPDGSRRGRLAAAGTVGAVVAVVAVAAALLAPVGTPATHASVTSARQQAYDRAAREFSVPPSVLLAVSYLESRWDTHRGQPSTDAGYGPMGLTDVTAANPDAVSPTAFGVGDSRGDPMRPRTDRATAASLHTAAAGAALAGTSTARVRSDPTQNIRAGAALLARYQTAAGQPLTSDPADWYAAVAQYSGASDAGSARWFADQAYGIVAKGERRTTDDGLRVVLPAQRVTPDRGTLAALHLPAGSSGGPTECPRSLACEWIPAPYQEYVDSSGELNYGNHDLANRPVSQRIRYIVIHDTEGSYPGVIKLAQDPTYVSWNYTIRNSDGHIAQHVLAKDVAWHAGNWYVNSTSIGIEHEGWAARGTWFSETMYRRSAILVRYLAAKYHIPLDRQHILGHDNVPAPTTGGIPDMHWDPGPYWDWNHYFALLGRPFLPSGTSRTGLVTIRPDFASNHPAFTGCENQPGPPGEGTPPTCGPDWGSGSVVLHTAPSENAPLLKDIGLHPTGDGTSTMDVADVGSRVETGQQYAVAGVQGDWTAIWYLGQKGWFHNPAGKGRTALWATGLVVTPKAGRTAVPIYGRAYPEASAYPAGVPVQPLSPLPYTMAAGQRYVLGGSPEAEYYQATAFDPTVDHTVVRGALRYYQIQFGHRIEYVRADDVTVQPSWSGIASGH